MQFGEIFRVLVRRWRVSVPVLLLTIAASVGIYVKLPPSYQSSAVLTLVASKNLATYPGNGNNPYLALGGLGPMTGILITELSSPQAIQQLAKLGVTDTFTAAQPVYDPGPFLSVSLTGKNPAEILHSMPIVIKFAQQQLYAMQQSPSAQVPVPANGQIKAVVIASPSSPTPILKKKRELVAGVAIVGLVLLFLLSFGAEAIARRRNGDSAGTTSGHAEPRVGSPDATLTFNKITEPERGRPDAPARPLEPALQQLDEDAEPEPGKLVTPARPLEPALRQSTVSNEITLQLGDFFVID